MDAKQLWRFKPDTQHEKQPVYCEHCGDCLQCFAEDECFVCTGVTHGEMLAEKKDENNC